ncbi:MAG TPA: D-aminoacyl-tRNA deacylase [Candidatus Bathyarchaeia archaeon]|nr:D-aminoacyl-tRNA deacylase [Candidatus Bathyarchaeia archaeon]
MRSNGNTHAHVCVGDRGKGKIFMETFFSPNPETNPRRTTMILVAASSKDMAGTNIAKQVLNNYPFSKTAETYQENPVYSAEINGKQIHLVTLKDESICAQNLPEHFNSLEIVVFLSRHSSQSGKPTLSVHTPGNFANAELGGLPRRLSVSPAAAMHDALKALAQFKTEMKLDYEVSYECTHHGPSLNVPTMFVELGSSPKQWSDHKAAEAVAKAAMDAIIKFQASNQTAALGIGGPHYNPKFTKMTLENDTLFGHIIPKYALSHVDAEILQQCVERTQEKVDHAILDWKGIKGEDKPKILEALAEINLPYQKF